MAVLAIPAARDLVASALRRAGANAAMADATAHALVLAESQGLGSHGLSRVPQYVAHLRNARVNGDAVPTVVKQKGDRKSTRLNSSHPSKSRMPSSA